MRQRAILGAVLLVGVGAVLGATVFRTDIAQATRLAQAVTIDNTPANAVPVREVREPFQQLVSAISTGAEACNPINVPAGKRLVMESLSASSSSTFEPHVYSLPRSSNLHPPPPEMAA